MKTRKKKYLMADSGDEDDDSVLFSVENGEAKSDRSDHSRERSRAPKDGGQFEGEWGYSIVKALKGKTVGRRLRRSLFKFWCFQFFCGLPLLIITSLECKLIYLAVCF